MRLEMQAEAQLRDQNEERLVALVHKHVSHLDRGDGVNQYQ